MSNAKGYYIRTHNGHPQITMLSEVEHGPGMVLVQSNNCRDGSVNDHYDCGCIINRPRREGEQPSSPRTKPNSTAKRSKREWLDELLEGMEE